MMSNIKEKTLKLEVKSEANSDNAFLSENEHLVRDSIDSMVDDYSRFKVKKELEYIDNEEPSTDSLKQLNATYTNFICKEEINDEGQSEISDEFKTENQQNVEEFSENSGTDEKIDISEIILQSSDYNEDNFKYENEDDDKNGKGFTRRKSMKQRKEKKERSNKSMFNKNAKIRKCQFCNKSFAIKPSLDDHLLKQHKEEIKGDLKSIITSKIHTCNICNAYETTNKNNFDRHVNSVHKEIITINSPDDDSICKEKEKIENCQFCSKSFSKKMPLDEHILKRHKQEVKGDLKSLITSKIFTCTICKSYETTYKNNIIRHVNLVHNEVNCQFCTESFIAKRSLDEHVLRMHRDKIKNNIKSFITSEIHICQICKSFETIKKSSLDLHINSAHNEVKIIMKCKFCTESFLNKHSLDRHLLSEHKDDVKNNIKSFIINKIYICKICNSYETTNKSSLNWHINSVHNEVGIKMKCQFCADSFLSKKSMDKHILRKHNDNIKTDRKSKINICDSSRRKSNVRQNLAHDKVKMQVKCQFCTESFIRKRSLDAHLLRKHKDNIKNDIKSFITSKIYVCTVCNSYETTLKSSLNWHINSVHNEVRIKIKCQFCTESFLSKKWLDEHILRKHSDNIKNDIKSFITSKIHICKICDSYVSTRKSNVDQHVCLVHDKVKIQLNCQFCTESFTAKLSLDAHVLRKHKDNIKNDIKSFITSRIYVCTICKSYETTLKSSLNWHINSVHNEVRLKMKCQFCTESFLSKKSLDEHILRKHNDKIKNDIKSFITSKIHICETCDYVSTRKSNVEQHVCLANDEVKMQMKCQFCTESFTAKRSLDAHLLRKHKGNIKHDIKSFITSKIYICKTCNSFTSMNKWSFNRHINSAHNEIKTQMKCQFCTKSFMSKVSLNGHILRKHKDKIEGDIKSVITN